MLVFGESEQLYWCVCVRVFVLGGYECVSTLLVKLTHVTSTMLQLAPYIIY